MIFHLEYILTISFDSRTIGERVLLNIKSAVLNTIGLILHYLSYKKVKRFTSGSNGIVLMAGPSSDLDDFTDEHYSVSITSNLMKPDMHIKRVSAERYYHCFSDPSIVSDQRKFKIFCDVVEFSDNSENYYILIPVQYLKWISIWKLLLKGKVLFYNQNMTYQSGGGN